jgi:hypothetical protein
VFVTVFYFNPCLMSAGEARSLPFKKSSLSNYKTKLIPYGRNLVFVIVCFYPGKYT